MAKKSQRGVALIALLAVIMMGSAWLVVTRLNHASASFTARASARNAEVLNRAKQALIGYVAAQALKVWENNPGSLPCPENPGDFDSTSGRDGMIGSGCGSSLKVGRFPWRTIGTEKLVDAYGEPLWYVVSKNWGIASSSSNTVINSNTTGQLTVDGVANDAIALIFAPGPAATVSATTGCTARTQARPTTGTPNVYDYLECENATGASTGSFVTSRTTGTFNDQVLKITVADIMPALETAIANRIEREIAPLLTGVYSANSSWGNLTTLLPMAVGFSIASSYANAFAGAPAMQGLLPLSYAETSSGSGAACTPSTAPNYCEPNFVNWSGAPSISISADDITPAPANNSCSIATAVTTTINCIAYGHKDVPASSPPAPAVTIIATATKVGAALRTFNTLVVTGLAGVTATAVFSTSSPGDATTTVKGTASNGSHVNDAFCGLSGGPEKCFQYDVSIPIFLFKDHANVRTLLETDTSTSTAWFARNQWHLVSYYAVASEVAPGGAGSCTTGSTCLTVNYHRNSAGTVDAGAQRAILLLPGQALSGQNRTSATLSNWFEGNNASGMSPFEMRSPTLIANRTFNDRIAVLSTN